jgi:hypothetical protein
MARSYTKRDDSYWSKVSQPKSQVQETSTASSFEPESFGDPFVVLGSEMARASTRTSSETSGGRINRSAITPTIDKYSQLRQMTMPYAYHNWGVDMRDAIELTQKAYANVATYKNAVDLMSEFSNTEVYLKYGNKASRDFFARWFRKINLWDLKKNYFLEYFRSSNIFLYRVDGKFSVEDFMRLSTVYAEEDGVSSDTIPLKYILLNPYDMVATNTSSFYEGAYQKVLSKSELARLKNPITDDDKELFEGLPEDAKKLIKQGIAYSEGIRIKLDPKKIHTSFAKKQHYEPFAIPFGWPVLEDINAKIEMKRADQAIMRTVENVILLIKTGEKKDQYGGGINQQNIESLRKLFMNGTTGRTLVADYTTTADFILPDLKKVLGPEKYTILNQDIREGLQNIIVGEEKYGNTQAKINVFLDKLREARNSFLEFLQAEIKRVSKVMGFRQTPVAMFTDISLQDNTELMRVANRLAELGILTPQELMRVFRRGEFPDDDEIGLEQEQYIKDRKDNKWMPLSPVPITQAPPPALDPNKAVAGPASTKKTPTMKSAGRPSGSKASVSLEKIKEITLAANNLESFILDMVKVKTGADLTADQKSLARELTERVVSSAEPDKWESLASECVETPSKIINLHASEGVQILAAESGLDDYAAALYVWAAN